jgi:hypothetical protein
MPSKSKPAKRETKRKRSRAQTTGQSTAVPGVLRDFTRLSPGRGTDVAAFLQAAVKADPSSHKGQVALRAAEAAALRVARSLRRQARLLGGPKGKELDRRAQESYFRAVLARQLPNLVTILRQRPTREPAETEVVALLPTVPSAPTNVQATAGVLSATVRWTPNSFLESVISYTVTPFIGTAAQTPTTVPATFHETTMFGLIGGTTYRFRVSATNSTGTSALSEFSNDVTPSALPIPGVGGSPLDVPLPEFSSDPALLIDAAAEVARGYISDAARVGQKWRFEYLKAQALIAAREALNYEAHIARMMALAVEKVGTSETILNATLLQAVEDLKNATEVVTQAASAPEINSLLDPLAETAAQSLLLPRFFAWLIEKGPLNFWIGFFEAIISDLASVIPVFGSATTFGRTRRFLQSAFDNNIDGVKDALKAAATDILARLDGEIDRMIAPLRAATAAVIQGTKQAMADVFEASDITLLMTPPVDAGGADVPDLDPFEDLYEKLNAQVDQLAAQIKERVTNALKPLIDGTGADLFKTIVIVFLALPILAFLVISLAGGPFSAALLAAAVLLAAEELLRLLVRWLAGPLLRKIDELTEQLAGLIGKLQGFFALQAGLIRNQSPEDVLKILASELRQLRDFLPQTFLEDATGLLEEARNVVLRTATQLGLSAEQALAQENATAFEVVRDDYATNLAPAPQLPGGSDPSRLAGAALLRDLGRLDERRTTITDGKDLEFTHRLSLLKLLGGSAVNFQQFLQSRELVVALTEGDLLDRTFPGVYRALIKEVRVTGIFAAAPVGALGGVPLTITHLGESRTRIKRGANPLAPPLALPECFPKTPLAYSRLVVGPPKFTLPVPFPQSNDPLVVQIRRAFATLPDVTVGQYFAAFLFALFAGLNPGEFISQRFRKALLEQLLESLERLAIERSCGLVDPAALVAAARALLEQMPFGDIILPVVLPAGATNPNQVPNLEPAIRGLAARLRAGVTVAGVALPGLVQVAQEAWSAAAASFRKRIARWGDAFLEEDPDPQVRSLGFATLVRRTPVEALVFNLLPAGPAPNLRAEPAVASTDGPPFIPASSLQYRPFENRGLEGNLLLRLETLGDDTFVPLGNSLSDILLDVTVRGCYDPDLARTVRASRSQTASGLGIASNLTTTPIPIGQPDSLVRIEAGASELRTVHYSLRAHRDKTLQVWRAAVTAQPAQTGALATLLAGKTVLGRDTAFEPLDPAATSFAFEFANAPLPNSLASLQGLAAKLSISPADLGFNAGILPGRTVLEEANLVSLGVAVVPMPDGVRGVNDPDTVDPLNIQMQVTGLLGNLLPGFAAFTPLPQRLKMAVAPQAADLPKLADLFAAPAAPAIAVQLDGALAPTPRIYDVIVSLSFRVPVLHVRTPITAIR